MASLRNEQYNGVFNSIFNEENLPTVPITHSILSEKTKDTEENYENLKDKKVEGEKDILDAQFINGLGDLQNNRVLLSELKKNL